MRILDVRAENFGSYRNLNFYFERVGLALISGATGSGKSTIQDLVPWVLWGETAKGGAVDDVRTWSTSSPTKGILNLEIDGKTLTVTRIRGSSSQNDLYWTEDSSEPKRGKDIKETQRLLDDRIGISSEVYNLCAYYNEFSASGRFFTAKATERRDLFEHLADLTLPNRLIDRISDVKRTTKKTHSEVSESLAKERGRHEQLTRQETSIKRSSKAWSEKQRQTIEELEAKIKTYEEDEKARINAAQSAAEAFEFKRENQITIFLSNKEAEITKAKEDSKCEHCQKPPTSIEKTLSRINSMYETLILNTASQPNPHLRDTFQKTSNLPSLLQAQINITNPFELQHAEVLVDLEDVAKSIETLSNQQDTLSTKLVQLNSLRDVLDNLSEELRKIVVSSVEAEVNRVLQTYFDAEIKVEFKSAGGDKIEVSIWKSGNLCAYSQLSKGQRGLLKLAFSVACMKAASQKASQHINVLFFDEPADGADQDLKIKTYNLFADLALSHETILVIDHSEPLQNMFETRYDVRMESDYSYIKRI